MPPDIGYPDYQRVVNWDSPVLFSGDTQIVTSFVQSGALDVSRYAYLGGFLNIQAGVALVTLEWFLDQAMTVIVGERQFTIDSNIGNLCQPKILHMGPFLQVSLETMGGQQFTIDWSLFATNRAFPAEFVPTTTVILDEDDINVPVGTFTYYPSDYFSGPVLAWADSLNEAVTIGTQYLDVSGAYVDLLQFSVPAAGRAIQSMVMPGGAWRVLVYNQSTAQTGLFLKIVPSMTGSS